MAYTAGGDILALQAGKISAHRKYVPGKMRVIALHAWIRGWFLEVPLRFHPWQTVPKYPPQTSLDKLPLGQIHFETQKREFKSEPLLLHFTPMVM